MSATDWKKILKPLFSPSAKEPQLVEVPERSFLAIDGVGDPEAPAFQEAIGALYSLAYTIKFALKAQGVEFSVMPLEGLWAMADGSAFDVNARDRWGWTAMIGQPDAVKPEHVSQALDAIRKKKKHTPAHDRVRFERIREGLAAQIMHIGPYAEEGPTVEQLHAFVAAHGYELHGLHHEIYLGDPRRSAPEKLKTILRHPVRKP